MKLSLSDIPQRILVRPNTQDEILQFGKGNVYPQITENAVKSSGRAVQCTNIFGKFVRGKGMAVPFYKTVINSKGLTVDKMHRKNVDDYKIHKGFAIHFNYNALGEIISMTPIPFKELRLGDEDEAGRITNVKHHPDWGREFKTNFDNKKITEYPLYNPGNAVAEALDAGGFQNYRGQILWWSSNGLNYPESSIDAVFEDVIADDSAKQFRQNNIDTNFLASHVISMPEYEGEDKEADERKLDKMLSDFQGAKRTSKLLVLFKKPGQEKAFDIEKIDNQDYDGLFKVTEDSVKDSIRNNFMIPPVLCSDLVAGKMGTAQEIQDAFAFLNSVTQDDRLIFEEVYAEIFTHWHDQNAVAGANYTIQPMVFGNVMPV